MAGTFSFLGLVLSTSGVRGILGLLVKAKGNSLQEERDRVSNAWRNMYV